MAYPGPYPQLAPSLGASRKTGAPCRPSSVHVTAAALTAALGLLAVGGYAAAQLGDTGTGNPAAAAMPRPLQLTDRVLTPSAFAGFVETQQPTVVRSPSAWATTFEASRSPARETGRLQALGYVGGVAEQLHGRYPLMAQAISVVEQYRSASSARAELAYQYSQLKNSHSAKAVTFPVGIPGGRGVSVTGAGYVGLNVMFTEGPYYYIVGTGSPANAHGVPTPTQLVGAAGTLYMSINGCVAQSKQASTQLG